MRFSMILASAGLVVGLLGGCGGSTSGTGSGPVPRSQFASRFASAVCDNIGGCCRKAGYPYDANTCNKAIVASDSKLFPTTGVTYNAQAAGKCLDAISAAMASCKGLGDLSATSCEQVFTGNKAAGQSCTNSGECASVANSDVSCSSTMTLEPDGGMTTTPGVCVVTPRGKQGDRCDSTCTSSGNGSGCSSGAISGSGGGDAGGSSATRASCYTNDGLYCGKNGVCDPLIAIGQPCPDYAGCVDGAYCDKGTCRAKLGAGSPCTSSDDCKDGTYCPYSGSPASRTCQNKKPDGAACQSFQECKNDCVSGTCTAPGGISPGLCSGKGNVVSVGTSGGDGGITPMPDSGGTFNGPDAGAGGSFNGMMDAGAG